MGPLASVALHRFTSVAAQRTLQGANIESSPVWDISSITNEIRS